jgi:hypothetical protein
LTHDCVVPPLQPITHHSLRPFLVSFPKPTET